MADHHDILDSALDLLRSRQWAGPATNPVLEKQFMHPTPHSRGISPRLVLGILGALLGCGAVAAATRPAWRAAILGSAHPARKAIALAPPTRVDAPARSISSHATPVAPAAAHLEPSPAPAPLAASTPPPAPRLTMDQARPAIDLTGDDAPERLRRADPRAFYQGALAAYLERFSAGDADGCMDVARSVRGEPSAGKWWARDAKVRADLSESLAQLYTLELLNAKLNIAYAVPQTGTAQGIELKLDASAQQGQPAAAEPGEDQMLFVIPDQQDLNAQRSGSGSPGTIILRIVPRPQPPRP